MFVFMRQGLQVMQTRFLQSLLHDTQVCQASGSGPATTSRTLHRTTSRRRDSLPAAAADRPRRGPGRGPPEGMCRWPPRPPLHGAGDAHPGRGARERRGDGRHPGSEPSSGRPTQGCRSWRQQAAVRHIAQRRGSEGGLHLGLVLPSSLTFLSLCVECATVRSRVLRLIIPLLLLLFLPPPTPTPRNFPSRTR